LGNLSIALIIPIFNEKENILKIFDKIKYHKKYAFTVYLIYDFENDNTIPIVKKNINNYNFEIILIKNLKKGPIGAIETGFKNFKEDFCIVTMADLSDDLSNVDIMVNKFLEGYDIVCASRYMQNGIQIGGGVIKKTLSKFAGISLNFFTGIPTKDSTNNFRLYSKRFLQSVSIESNNGFELGIELVVKGFLSKNIKICEIPTIWKERTLGKSKFRLFAWIPYYLRWYVYAFKIFFK